MMHTSQNLSCERELGGGEMGVAEDHKGMLIMENKNIQNGHGQRVSWENRFE